MSETGFVRSTPWDSLAFGLETYEITTYSRAALEHAEKLNGHCTIKVDPLVSKKLLHEFGYYYCDTLIEPHCTRCDFIPHYHEKASVSTDIPLAEFLPICHGAFEHGRFHRDFNLDRGDADRRYDNWLEQLYREKKVLGLMFDERLAGFLAFSHNKLVLHAVGNGYRGKGIAKHLWTAACMTLYDAGHEELCSSVSASNLSVVNLYVSLGFKFRSPLDIYHKLNLHP